MRHSRKSEATPPGWSPYFSTTWLPLLYLQTNLLLHKWKNHFFKMNMIWGRLEAPKSNKQGVITQQPVMRCKTNHPHHYCIEHERKPHRREVSLSSLSLTLAMLERTLMMPATTTRAAWLRLVWSISSRRTGRQSASTRALLHDSLARVISSVYIDRGESNSSRC